MEKSGWGTSSVTSQQQGKLHDKEESCTTGWEHQLKKQHRNLSRQQLISQTRTESAF